MANYKHRLLKEYIQGNVSFQYYNNYKNNLCRLIKESKHNYFINKFNSNKNNIGRTWKLIHSIMSKSSKKSDYVTLLDESNNEIKDPVDVSNSFCDFFCSVAGRLDADLQRTEKDPMTYMPDTLPDVFVPNPATPDEVEQLINSFKEKPCNINAIPIFIFKKLSIIIIAPVISNMLNSAIAEGTFPSILKIARVIPLHKAKSRKVKNNYRQISLILFISKLIEKLIEIRACNL